MLHCSYNNLTSLKGIENLTKLTELYCDIDYDTIEKEQKRLKIIRRKEIIKNILV